MSRTVSAYAETASLPSLRDLLPRRNGIEEGCYTDSQENSIPVSKGSEPIPTAGVGAFTQATSSQPVSSVAHTHSAAKGLPKLFLLSDVDHCCRIGDSGNAEGGRYSERKENESNDQSLLQQREKKKNPCQRSTQVGISPQKQKKARLEFHHDANVKRLGMLSAYHFEMNSAGLRDIDSSPLETGVSSKGEAFAEASRSLNDADTKSKWACPECGKRFYSKYNMQVHMLIHKKSWPYACRSCPRVFRTKGNLNDHEQVGQIVIIEM